MRKRAYKRTDDNVPAKGKRTRAAIVARALRIVSVEGLAALTFGRLEKELRMSKSGLFAHFRSKEALELATVERAKDIFEDKVLRSAECENEGIETLWNLCDLWLEHIAKREFPAYFVTTAFFAYAKQTGPVPHFITETIKEWFHALKTAVTLAQKHREIDRAANAKQTALALNSLLLGAYWAHLMGHWFALHGVRDEVLEKLQGLSTTKIPAEAFESVHAFRRYLKERQT